MQAPLVVIGAGIGGLSAAIHARLLGFPVVVLEQRDAIGGKAAQIHELGYRLDPGPSIVILTHLYEEVFRRAGKSMADSLRFRRLDPWTRVYFEGQTDPIDLPAGFDECLALLDEFAPGDRKAFEQLMADLEPAAEAVDQSIFAAPVHQPWKLVSPGLAKFARHVSVFKPFREEVDRRFQSPILRAFFYGFPSYGGQSFRTASPGSFLIPYYMMRHGVWWPEGGIGAIPRAFEQLARELGVEIRTSTEVVGLRVEGGRVRAVQCADGEEIATIGVISNRDRLKTREWLGHRVDWQPSYSYFTLHLGVRRPMPELKHHTLLIPREFEPGFLQLYDERRFPARPIVYINETTQVEAGSAPEGCTNFFAVVTSPAKHQHLDWERDQTVYRDRVLEECRLHGIDIQLEELDFCRIQTPETFEARDGNYLGSLYGPDEKHRLWGFMPLRCADEQVKNLFYAGGSVQPGAGMPMVTLSGKFAADLAARAIR